MRWFKRFRRNSQNQVDEERKSLTNEEHSEHVRPWREKLGMSEACQKPISCSEPKNSNTWIGVLQEFMQGSTQDSLSVAALLTYYGRPCDSKFQEAWLHIVQTHITRHFPSFPPESAIKQHPEQLRNHLLQVQEVVLRELGRLSPVLREVKLLDSLIDQYHRQIFNHLDLVLQTKRTHEQAYWTVDWVFRIVGITGLREVPEFYAAIDPMQLTHYIQWAVEKLLSTVKDEIAALLSRILENDAIEQADYDNEEAFIQFHLDVIQCLDRFINRGKMLSHSVMLHIKRICLCELHAIVQRYIYSEKKALKDLSKKAEMTEKYLRDWFKIFNSCYEIRLYVQQLCTDENEMPDSAGTVSMLQTLEIQAKNLLLEKFDRLAEVNLKKYFHEEDRYMDTLKMSLKKYLAVFPEEIMSRGVILDEVYGCIISVYQKQLLKKSKYKKLSERWGDVGDRITRDAEELHSFFCAKSCVKDRNKVLLQISMVLGWTDVSRRFCSNLDINHDNSDKLLYEVLVWWGGRSAQEKAMIREYKFRAGSLPSCCLWWPLRCC
ncbi:uncharacterized protein LOC114798163 isoform X2 [Denticeps clupeoides]|uniref:uncharacterized protein LOC114798163 isoform X2 n=1 Tax=Denticeps clupeoides TaxID=299321 RepID=UPI0010A54879|nr:uncharacterized protein LOC114798163 isoform X2 [Denticeps clupeoides]